MSPFKTKTAQHEVRDVETMAIIRHQRPEEMQIVRWAAQAGTTFKEDLEDGAKTIEASTPILMIALAWIGMTWVGMLILVVFGMAMKGTALSVILWKVLNITYIMGVVSIVLVICHLLVTTIGVMILRRCWRLVNWAMGRKRQGWMFSAADLFKQSAYGH